MNYAELINQGISLTSLLRGNSGNCGEIGELLELAADRIKELEDKLELNLSAPLNPPWD